LTHLSIMPKRYMGIAETIAGLQQTGVPLVAAKGGVLDSATTNDDPGIYYFVPLLARQFNLSLDQSIDAFLVGLVALGFLLGLAGCWFLFRTWSGRLLAVVPLGLVSGVALVTGDVYVAPVAAVLGVVPFFLHLALRGSGTVPFAGFLLLAGVGTAMAQTVRIHSGTPVWILIATWILFGVTGGARRKLVLGACLALGILGWQGFFSSRLDRRDAYLTSNQPGFTPQHRVHIFWSPIYEGLGFLGNDFGLVWNDEAARANIEAIAPGVRFTSPEYEQIVKAEVVRLTREHPYFMARTVFAKLGVMFMLLLFTAHVGLIAAWLYPKGWVLETSFWLPMALSSLPGVLVMPWHGYVSGFLALAAVYAAVSLDHALHRRASRP
jgi:hypothetical protein